MNRVLLIDDEASVAEAVQHVLKGYKIVSATTAAEGIATASSDDFQVVVVDLNLKSRGADGHEGHEVIRKLHARRPRLPIILMTAYDTPRRFARSSSARSFRSPYPSSTGIPCARAPWAIGSNTESACSPSGTRRATGVVSATVPGSTVTSPGRGG